MARGITEADVWNACDALLIDGARPTIERVRQKIGSGSPNTVSPHLDAWFRRLGGRLRGVQGQAGVQSANASDGTLGVHHLAATPGVPAPVADLAQQTWEAALAHTRLDFDERLRQGMEAAVSNVEAEKARAAQAESSAFDAASRAARLQSELNQRAAQLDEQRLANATLAATLAASERRAADLQQRIDELRRESAEIEATADAAVEKSRADVASAIERLAATERRTVLEIDRERGLRQKAEKRCDALERRLDASVAEAKAERIREAGALSDLQAEKAVLADQVRQARQRDAALAQELSEALAALAQARAEASAARSQTELVDSLLASMKVAAATPKRRGAARKSAR